MIISSFHSKLYISPISEYENFAKPGVITNEHKNKIIESEDIIIILKIITSEV